MDSDYPAMTIGPTGEGDEALLDAWMTAWCTLVAQIRRLKADPASRKAVWHRLARAEPVLAAFEEAVRLADTIPDTPEGQALRNGITRFDLRTSDGQAFFHLIWLDRRLDDRKRPLDGHWLAGIRRARDDWEAGAARFLWPEEPDSALAPLKAVTLADGQPLADFLCNLKSTKPSAKWADRAASIAAGSDADKVRAALIGWLGGLRIGGSPVERRRRWQAAREYYGFLSTLRQYWAWKLTPAKAALLHVFNLASSRDIWDGGPSGFGSMLRDPAFPGDAVEDAMRAAVWLLAEWRDGEVTAALRTTAIAMLMRLQATGDFSVYRSQKVANACLAALGRIATPEAVAALAAIKLALRDKAMVKKVDTALGETAARAGVTIEELEELSVPSFDLQEVGERIERVGDHLLALRVASAAKAKVEVRTAAGKVLKSVPSAIQRDEDAKAVLKSLKDCEKEIAKVLPTVRRRIEASYLSGKTWPADTWRARFLDHPLVGTIARRLIWSAEAPGAAARTFIWFEGGLVDVQGRPAEPAAEDAVRLWHPLTAGEGEVAAWRSFLSENRLVQPFKQAHREVYPLTDAERQTATYSNRFAGHILRQFQSVNLARSRGWDATLRMAVDAPNDEPTHIRLPAAGLAGVFWTESAGDDFTDTGVYNHLTTDRVVFRRLAPEGGDAFGLGDTVPLAEVPPLLFSEAMRDVDLFVGVATICNDPSWIDRGADAEHPNQWEREYREYWFRQAAAPLGVSAQERKTLLEAILPALTIAEKCSLEDRHLRVRGNLNSYRIHIGSGNILTDQGRYVCIVPDRKAARGRDFFLPFEGDDTVSVILSKAFLLVADDRITDPEIRRQISKAQGGTDGERPAGRL